MTKDAQVTLTVVQVVLFGYKSPNMICYVTECFEKLKNAFVALIFHFSIFSGRVGGDAVAPMRPLIGQGL